MEAHDLRATIETLGELEFRELAPFNHGTLGVYRASGGTSPWERHPDTLYVLEGRADVTIFATTARS